MSNVTTVGIDLAKSSFSVHGVDAAGVVVLRKTVSRVRLVGLVAEQPPCVIGLEACSGAHEWARRFRAFGHTVKLMAPRFVAPYRKNGKNDGNDAEAICEAVSRPHMRFIPIKTPEQQAVLCLHRVRQGFIEERTATINRLRGLLAEFGFVLPQRAAEVRRGVFALLEQLPSHAARALGDLREHLRSLDARVREYEHAIKSHARDNRAAQLAQQRQGIGPITASAIVASVGDVRPPVLRVARSCTSPALHRRQAAPRAHHRSRRSVFAHASRDGCEKCPAQRHTRVRSAVSLGARGTSSSRLSPRLYRGGCEECSRCLGRAQSANTLRHRCVKARNT
jgi:transposase